MRSLNIRSLFSSLLILTCFTGVIGCGEDGTTDPSDDDKDTTTPIVETENTFALRFDNGDYVRIAGSPSLQLNQLESFSVDAWIYADVWGLYRWVLAQAPSNANVDLLFGFQNGKARAIYNGIGNDLIGNASLSLDEWHHVAVVIERDSLALYVDGLLDKKRGVTPLDSAGVTDIIIGAREDPGLIATTESFQGILYEVRIWNQALTQEQISSAADTRVPDFGDQNGVFGSDAGLGLLARWSLSKGSGATVEDSSGNGHEGVIHGATWVTVENPFYSAD